MSEEDESLLGSAPEGEPVSTTTPRKPAANSGDHDTHKPSSNDNAAQDVPEPASRRKLATPAVRGILKELSVNIEEVEGTGRDGRVTKEDVLALSKSKASGSSTRFSAHKSRRINSTDDSQGEQPVSLSSIQTQMFKTMTKSLNIPHFLYADEIDVTGLSRLRQSLNKKLPAHQKLSYLPFIIKAVSLSLEEWPLLNARLETGHAEGEHPTLVMRDKHNIGIAMDTPNGLLVPNVKNIGSRSIHDIASETIRLQSLGKEGKLSTKDLSGGTITVSNIGSIGGTYVSPIIVQGEVAILGIGKARTIPAFDDEGQVLKKDVMNFSWSADHRVIDGATMARMAQSVKSYIEDPGLMMTKLR